LSFAFDKEQVALLKKSVEQVGYLQSVLVSSRTGKVLVGRTRKFSDPNWPERIIDVKDDLTEELIILHGNVQRVISAEETKARFVRIAKILEANGIAKNKVCTEMCKFVPYHENYVRRLLPAEYKMTSEARTHESATLLSRIPGKPDTGEVRTALEEIAQSGLNGNEPALPFPNCKCKECENKSLCY
jgi:hypothetical protein